MKDSGITRHPTNDLSLESDSKTPIVRETAEYIECDDELCDMSNISHSAEPKIVSDCEEADIIFPSENTAEEMHNLVRSVFGKFRLPYFLRAKQMCVHVSFNPQTRLTQEILCFIYRNRPLFSWFSI